MGDITTNDLLTLQRNITDAHREDMQQLRTDVTTQIRDVRDESRHDIGELRTLIEKRTQPGAAFELTGKQKAAVLSGGLALVGAVAEGARHLIVWLVAAIKSGAVIR